MTQRGVVEPAGMKFALISGTSIARSALFSDWEQATLETEHGLMTYRRKGEQVLLNRHGPEAKLPPHRINHRAHIAGLAALGFQDIVAVNSVGSLTPALPPGSWVSCSDYVALQTGPATFCDDELRGGKPVIANNLIAYITRRLASEFTIQTGKVYVQTRGPRFETKAEVRILKGWGDVVGMTLAPEADLCSELGLRYNSLAMVDNFAHGIEGAEIDFAAFDQMVWQHQPRIDRFLSALVEVLAGGPEES